MESLSAHSWGLISDERILEYDIDKVLFEEKSPYQKILIVHSRSLGNLLVLDDLQSKFDFFHLLSCGVQLALVAAAAI